MSYITGIDRSQVQLLPDTVDQYIGPDHPVRALEVFVDSLDAAKLGFAKAQPADTGRPPYHPLDLLRLFLWGYFNRVRSSRRLETECGRNLELIWLLRGLRPDFKTIADFRRDNAVALPKVFREFVLLCRELKLYGQELVAIDGTKLKASNHPTRRANAEQLEAWLREIDERIAEYLAALAASETDLLGAPVPPVAAGSLSAKLAELRRRKDHLARVLAVAVESGAKVPLTDPDCQSMMKVGLGYNAQIAVDAKHHLIVVAEIAAQPTDHVQLPVVAAAASAMLATEPLPTGDVPKQPTERAEEPAPAADVSAVLATGVSLATEVAEQPTDHAGEPAAEAASAALPMAPSLAVDVAEQPTDHAEEPGAEGASGALIMASSLAVDVAEQPADHAEDPAAEGASTALVMVPSLATDVAEQPTAPVEELAAEGASGALVTAEVTEQPAEPPPVTAPLKVVADAGYHDQSALAAAEEAGFECYVPRPTKGHAAKHDIFPKSDFIYEPGHDGYRCLAGRLLPRSGEGYQKHGLKYQAYADPRACRACPLKSQCTKSDYRRVERWENEAVMETIAERVADHPEMVQARKSLVEHPFGTIKFWWEQDTLMTRGREHVQAELSLSAWAYNFRRVLNLLGVAGLRKALRERQAVGRGTRAAGRRRFGRHFRARQRLRLAGKRVLPPLMRFRAVFRQNLAADEFLAFSL
jgi:transposase